MKKIFTIILILLNVSIVNAISNPYKETGTYGTNCTWYVWNYVYKNKGIALPSWGNAKNWYKDASADGFEVGSTPRANSIVVWGSWTSYGHIGYVESTDGNTIKVWNSARSCIDEEDPDYIKCMEESYCEETDRACYQNAKRVACSYTLDEYQITGFIYLDKLPVVKEEVKNNTSTSANTNTNTNKNNNTETKKEEVKKSSNAYLKSITLSNGVINFQKDNFNYKVEVDSDIEEILVEATLEDSKSSITGLGEYALEVGSNKINLVVTSEDNTTLEYVIEVIRKEEVKEVEEIVDNKEVVEVKEETKDNNDNKLIIIIPVSLVLITLIIILVKRLYGKRKK